MDRTLTERDLLDHLADILRRVRDGERFTISHDGNPVATLAPPSAPAVVTLRDLAIRMADVPLPGDGFADTLEAVQSAQPRVEPMSWPS